jgi:phosphoribosylaminoimidazolecarboxamide formyltransferase/IMP cyclohydrolase
LKVKRALISVSDKKGLEELAKGLTDLGVEILSTGGTASQLSSMGIDVTEVSAYTGFPEMMDGRVKTLHPRVHAGILARRDSAEHMRQLEDNEILPVDMVVVNLYPFSETVSKKDVSEEEAVENIDIGGPTMLRSAAKNYRSVAVLSSPEQYGPVLEELVKNDASLSEVTLRELARRVFALTAGYDAAIEGYLSSISSPDGGNKGEMPGRMGLSLENNRGLRYGENPHQKAAYYRDVSSLSRGIAEDEQFQGKELSFNNILDLSAASEMVGSFSSPAVVVVKHNNPSGIATAEEIEAAFLGALDCDRMSAFGSIIGLNRPVTEALAGKMLEEAGFIECIIAPGYEKGALEILARKKNLRVIKRDLEDKGIRERYDLKQVPGGFLAQEKDNATITADNIKVATKEKPSAELLDSLLFAWNAVKYVKSNAIVLARGTKTVGIGAGQMSRVDSVIIAVRKAGEKANGAVLASDAFFPKADSIEKAHASGIKAIIQPGGSIRDGEVIEACDRFGIPMVFTGMRHFRH